MFGKNKQMSESMIMATALALGGGFRDAYSYNCRGQVFANTQTGNLVLLSQSIANKNLDLVLKYILPLFAFFIGVYLTEVIKNACKDFQFIHWRQIIAMMEIVILIIVGFMPTSMNHLANVTISLICAMQVQSFQIFHGVNMATTMCTGNLKNATELLSSYHFTDDEEKKTKCRYYYFTILMFCVGAALGAFSSNHLGIKSIWLDAVIMTFVFILMFKEESKC